VQRFVSADELRQFAINKRVEGLLGGGERGAQNAQEQ
jgi:hypothetical protein